VALDPAAVPGHLSLGFAAAGLRQSFTLSSPMPGVNLSQLNAQAFSMDAGVLAQPWSWLSLGFSDQDLNQPNLGVVGVARLPQTLRWGVGLLLPGGLTVNLAQSSASGLVDSQAGLQWSPPGSMLSLRCGLDSSSLGAGFGLAWSSLRLDYAYQWSLPGGDAAGLPGTHSLALAYAWSSARNRAQVWTEQGRQALAASRFSEALACARNALLLSPGDAGSGALLAQAQQGWDRQQAQNYAVLGQKALAQGRTGDAVQYLKWACSLDPSNAAYASQLGAAQAGLPTGILADALVQKQVEAVLACLAKGQTQEALDALQPALDHAPGDASLQALARLLKAPEGRAPTARPAQGPDTLRWMEDAVRFSGQGQPDLARQAWQKVLKADPDNALARRALAPEAGRPQAAPQDLKKAEALFAKGLAAYQNGDLRTAIRLWQQCLELDPNNLNAQNNLSRARIELENPN
jgi:tetratricopeptide (TPR) repeat protein